MIYYIYLYLFAWPPLFTCGSAHQEPEGGRQGSVYDALSSVKAPENSGASGASSQPEVPMSEVEERLRCGSWSMAVVERRSMGGAMEKVGKRW